jgi:CRP-like cAMP-binding protein
MPPAPPNILRTAKAILGKLGPSQVITACTKGQTVFRQGDEAVALYYIHAGRVKLTVISEQGKEAVVAILEAGDFFGEACLVGQLTRVATVTALSDGVIGRIPKGEALRAVHEDHAFAELLISYVLGRTVRVEADLVDQLFNSSEKRLARLLLLLANFGKDERPEPILAKISQETLADMIGSTRSRVSLFMNKFRKLGYIDYNGRIVVHTSLLNAVLHDHPAITQDH